ncbi:hypothetical protein KAW38_01325 [Candidatus Micrarchaeota archaeon]|nr:hypothetical protein [Candidatus Micrarchaeota archaeon]
MQKNKNSRNRQAPFKGYRELNKKIDRIKNQYRLTTDRNTKKETNFYILLTLVKDFNLELKESGTGKHIDIEKEDIVLKENNGKRIKRIGRLKTNGGITYSSKLFGIPSDLTRETFCEQDNTDYDRFFQIEEIDGTIRMVPLKFNEIIIRYSENGTVVETTLKYMGRVNFYENSKKIMDVMKTPAFNHVDMEGLGEWRGTA